LSAARKARPRGQALVELAILLPVFVLFILFSIYFTELLSAKLKLQEASRFVVWEMTSHPLDDFGGNGPNHEEAFVRARDSVLADAVARYSDLESAAALVAHGPFIGVANFVPTLEQRELPLSREEIVLEGNRRSLATALLGTFAGKTSDWVIRRAELNPQGWVHGVVSIEIANKIVPQNFLGPSQSGFARVDAWGDRDLSALRLRQHLSMVVSDWHMPDGSDAVMHAGRAGRHRGQQIGSHGLHFQTRRFILLGADLPEAPDALRKMMPVPHPDAAYVVAHNYRPLEDGEEYSCVSHPGYPEGARNGLNDLWLRSTLDARSERCFDTAPFRDTQDYDRSLYIQMFKARGPYFMGCQNAEADDPSSGSSAGDEAPRIPCR
jgi:hypothetical protein